MFNLLNYLKPQKLFTRMITLVFLALLLAQGISVLLITLAQSNVLLKKSESFRLRHFIELVQLIEVVPEQLHVKTVTAWQKMGREFAFTSEPPINPAANDLEDAMQQLLIDNLGDGYINRVNVNSLGEGSSSEKRKKREGIDQPLNYFYVAIQLENGQWFSSKMDVDLGEQVPLQQAVIFVILSSVFVIFVVYWQLRYITLPLRNLSDAANALGRGQQVDTLPEVGSDDLKNTLRAFNHMNERIQRFISERTRMLASISHDLRTPITGMRLRLEMMAPSNNRDKLIQSLEEMHDMSEATLTFLKQSEDLEATSLVDLGALVESLCQFFSEIYSGKVHYQQAVEHRIVIDARPLALKRAISNLIENALKYGKQAKVELVEEQEEVIISISDNGPGIPEDEMDSIFEPFYRLEKYHSHQVDGFGLGMSLAKHIINNHGGKLGLSNTVSGLQVLVYLPKG